MVVAFERKLSLSILSSSVRTIEKLYQNAVVVLVCHIYDIAKCKENTLDMGAISRK